MVLWFTAKYSFRFIRPWLLLDVNSLENIWLKKILTDWWCITLSFVTSAMCQFTNWTIISRCSVFGLLFMILLTSSPLWALLIFILITSREYGKFSRSCIKSATIWDVSSHFLLGLLMRTLIIKFDRIDQFLESLNLMRIFFVWACIFQTFGNLKVFLNFLYFFQVPFL